MIRCKGEDVEIFILISLSSNIWVRRFISIGHSLICMRKRWKCPSVICHDLCDRKSNDLNDFYIVQSTFFAIKLMFGVLKCQGRLAMYLPLRSHHFSQFQIYFIFLKFRDEFLKPLTYNIAVYFQYNVLTQIRELFKIS